MTMQLIRELENLASGWVATSRSRFNSAEIAPDEFSETLDKHGGFCYVNCALALRRLIDSAIQNSPKHETAK